MTFSIAARCARTGQLGIAVSSSSPAVAARCAHARTRAGAVGSQNITDPRLGFLALDLLEGGRNATETMADLLRAAGEHADFRQLTIVDRDGRTAVYSGKGTLGTHAAAEGPGVVCAGNLLANGAVPLAMRDAFLGQERLSLGARLIAAMQAGMTAGGEAGPVHSAGLKLVGEVAWPIADLRVDWHQTDPIGALAALWTLWEPQMDAYITRALAPGQAPSFGVPGDR
jgi:uncharacterized Ntn-hydrolase superfamily protein